MSSDDKYYTKRFFESSDTLRSKLCNSSNVNTERESTITRAVPPDMSLEREGHSARDCVDNKFCIFFSAQRLLPFWTLSLTIPEISLKLSAFFAFQWWPIINDLDSSCPIPYSLFWLCISGKGDICPLLVECKAYLQLLECLNSTTSTLEGVSKSVRLSKKRQTLFHSSFSTVPL